MKVFSDGEEIVEPFCQIFASSLVDKIIERKVYEISLSKQTVTRCTKEISDDMSAIERPCQNLHLLFISDG